VSAGAPGAALGSLRRLQGRRARRWVHCAVCRGAGRGVGFTAPSAGAPETGQIITGSTTIVYVIAALLA